MRQRISILRILCISLLTVALLAACDRRPLEVFFPTTARIRIDVDWMKKFGQVPSGMTMVFYRDGDITPTTVITNNVKSNYVDLIPGTYRMVLFNLSDGEFGSLRFEDMGSYEDFKARATQLSQHQYEAWEQGVRYMNDPEPLAVVLDSFTITEEMLEEQVKFYDWHEHGSHKVDTTDIVRLEVPEPMTTKLNVRVHVKGIQGMKTVVGNITGMANGCEMSQFWRTTETGTYLLDNWSVTDLSRQEGDDNTEGWITTTISVFGLPHGKEFESQREATDNIITLVFTLRDGTTKTFTFDVGKYIKYHGTDLKDITNPYDVVLDLDLILDALVELPYIPGTPDTGGSGFDAEVDDWEDGGTIDIGL